MKIKLLAILILFQVNVFAQKTYKLLDEVTKKPVAFASVYIEDENININSDEKGAFILNSPKNVESFVMINALGYEVKKIKYSDFATETHLKPKSFILDEVKVSNSKNTRQINIGTFKGNDSAHSSGMRSLFLLARYFPYSNDYDNYQFIKSITVLTKNEIKTAKFNLRIYSALDGKPSTLINQKNITVEVKKGKKLTTIDISDLNIIMPIEGVFIAYEWLAIPSNYHTNKATITDNYGNKKNGIMEDYQPMLCTIYEASNKNTWRYFNSVWRNGTSNHFNNK
ncbi:carboxypeptidase-like regulatory domain-containing protein [Pedobacter alpinus]|uniref:Carboxypeptidase-like regulatory domain-containing protein n=2 Tax=Pedobacter alpinus TaxID=1590643 RepID=A0ABW5TWP1_9SPHI